MESFRHDAGFRHDANIHFSDVADHLSDCLRPLRPGLGGRRMTGFSAPGGVPTKARLLTLEGAHLLAEP
jgi:hypothetical protein